MTRDGKFLLFLALAVIGGIGIALSTFAVIGPLRGNGLSMAHIVAGTIVVTVAMAWACAFVTRAHFARDEFKRQREISASYWGGWFGIAASTPIFFFIAAGGLGRPASLHAAPLIVFTSGYLLAPICGLLGTVAAQLWLRRRDNQ